MFHQIIIHWYLQNKRDLPWRHTTDPYPIWLSEIIMQQTRVEQGLPYYERFINAYPSISDFAAASEDDILHLWQGLGYYSRGRNMHKTAQQVVNEYQGKFPGNYEGLIQLKGIGPYTAAAIASFAFNEAKAVVDGNVYRVLARYFGIDTAIDSTTGKKEFAALAQSLIDPKNPSSYNQGIMEFGAMQCKPVNPNCGICPLANSCKALAQQNIGKLPVKSKKTATRERFFDYLIIEDQQQQLYIQKRTEKDIWHNLYQYPLIESTRIEEEGVIMQSPLWKTLTKDTVSIQKISAWNKHLLSHQKLFARFWHLQYDGFLDARADYELISKKSLNKFAFPQLINRYLQE